MKKYSFCLLVFIFLSCNDKKYIIQTIHIQNGLSIVWYEHGGMVFSEPVADIDLMKGDETLANLFKGDNGICKISFSLNTLLILTTSPSYLDDKTVKETERETGMTIIVDTACRIPSLYRKER